MEDYHVFSATSTESLSRVTETVLILLRIPFSKNNAHSENRARQYETARLRKYVKC